MNTWVARVLDLFFPRRCVGCGMAGSHCCAICRTTLPRAARWHTPALILFEYHDARVRRLIWLLKYRGARDIAQTFAAVLYEEVISELAERQSYRPGERGPWLVVPVPLAPSRLKKRGFNQAAEIAKHLVRHNTGVFELATDLLCKTRDTASQVSRGTRAARLDNLHEAFALNPQATVTPHGRNIILLDDVMTTGATLSEGTRALADAGAAHILPVAIAG